jgi:DNA-binding response OmpR family regulator
MGELDPSDGCWRLHEGRFDERSGVLQTGGQTSELDRSCRAILALLLRHAGAPVSKERLLEAGWPARIVHENSLAKAIGRLRDALGAHGDCLKAVYGVGYKLEAAVLAPVTRSQQTPVGEPAEARPRPRASRQAITLSAILGSAALIALAFALRESAAPAPADVPVRQAAPAIADAPDAIGKVLWVDDHPENNVVERRFFEKHRIAVHPVTTSEDALKLLAIYDYQAVISDMGRGEDRLAGARFAQQLRARNDRTPVVIYTVRADNAAKQQAQRQLVAESGAQALAVTPQEVRAIVLDLFGNPPERAAD